MRRNEYLHNVTLLHVDIKLAARYKSTVHKKSIFLEYMCFHVYTHAHTHTCTRAPIHPCTHTHMHTRTHAHTTNTHIPHTHTHTCTYKHTYTHTRTLTHIRFALDCIKEELTRRKDFIGITSQNPVRCQIYYHSDDRSDVREILPEYLRNLPTV